MRDTFVLLGRFLKEAFRRPTSRRLALFALLLLLTVLVGLGRGARGASTVTGASLLVVGVVAFVAAAASGSLLPRDLASGRTTWLATLKPTGASHRVAAALAGGGLALAFALAGALVVALVVPRLVDHVGVRHAEPLPFEGSQRLAPLEQEAPAWRLALPSARAGDTVEVTFAPPYALADAPLVTPRVAWRVGDVTGEVEMAYGRPLRVEIPAAQLKEATALEVRNLTPATWLFVREARLLGRRASFVSSLLVAGLLLGLAAAVLAPVAVLVSRFTSAPTAVLAGLVLALAGVLAPMLIGTTSPAEGWSEAWGTNVLSAAARLAPDLSGLGVLGEPGLGHALTLAALRPFLAPLGYALIVLVLVALPLPRAWRRGEGS